jgi:inosine-uridine nucleoside N-ribohydrolase
MVLDANALQFSVPMSKAIAASGIRMKSRPFEENSILTRGESVVDRLGVTNRQANCFVMVDADHNKFFSLLQKELKNLT